MIKDSNKTVNFDLKNKVLLGIFLFSALSLIILVINPANAETDSPRKQIKQGIAPEDVTCKEGYSLVIRNNGSPACVKSETGDRFEKRGMGKIIVQAENKVQAPTNTNIQIKDLEKTQIDTKRSGDIQVPAVSGSVVNFYITDDNLNLAHKGIETVSTQGLFEFSINGIPIVGPSSIIETGPDTGQFYGKLQLPDTINGRPLNQNDIVLIKYLQASDNTGNKQTITKSIPLTSSYATVETVGDSSRIGRTFTVRVYDPNSNLDSQENDSIPLSKLEYDGKGGIKTTLSNPAFDANSSYMIETGENTGIFEVKIKIPRKIDGKLVDIGDWYEIKYIDSSTPSGTTEEIVLQGTIG